MRLRGLRAKSLRGSCPDTGAGSNSSRLRLRQLDRAYIEGVESILESVITFDYFLKFNVENFNRKTLTLQIAKVAKVAANQYLANIPVLVAIHDAPPQAKMRS